MIYLSDYVNVKTICWRNISNDDDTTEGHSYALETLVK
jgi:hypothetical protein